MEVEMELYTSYFAKVKQLKEMGYDNLVCVAGYAPKFYFDTPKARFYPDLAPKREWWKEWQKKFKDNPNSPESQAWYEKKYQETVLDKLDPQTVLKELGDKAVMLCYEKPGDFCHRQLIAWWLSENTGVDVWEVKF